MKRIATFIFFILALFSVNLVSQVINVQPGYGTLNDAITANGGNKTYQLQAGGWYGLNTSLEINEPITIIGEPVSAGQMPAMIQTGSDPNGVSFSNMFTVRADFTIRNAFLINADLNNSYSPIVMNQTNPARIVFDSVTIDPTCGWILLNLVTGPGNIHITNSLFLRHSYESSGIYDYPFLNSGSTAGFDTIFVENSTFVDMGQSFYDALVSFQRGGDGFDKFIWFNHNSFIFGKSDLLNAFYTNSTFFTNNLMWEWDILPFTNDFGIWWENFGDEGPNNTRTCLIKADTLSTNGVNESFPSQRKYFVAYNYNYRDPRINDLIQLGKDSGHVSYLQYLVNPPSMKDTSREAQMFSDKNNFPYFIAAKNIEDQPDTDPKFVDQKMYSLIDSAISWAGSVAKQTWGFPTDSYPAPADWAHFYYTTDEAAGNPLTWPRFNGVYSNPQLLTGSIEGLPLGDLNWFPDKKAIWQQHQTEVMNHILGEDSTVMNITAVKPSNNSFPASYNLSQNYPNPFNPTTIIQYSIPKGSMVTLKVFNLLGQEVATLVNQEQKAGNYTANFNASKLASGVYMYKIQAGSFSLSRKMMLLK
jgi:hypothetical protein